MPSVCIHSITHLQEASTKMLTVPAVIHYFFLLRRKKYLSIYLYIWTNSQILQQHTKGNLSVTKCI